MRTVRARVRRASVPELAILVARSACFASLLGLGLAPTSVLAQQQGSDVDPFAGVEEMVVTGSQSAELLNPSTTSAIGFDADALADIGVEDVGDLDAYVPNLSISSVNATNASFFIRGVGLQDFGANASSSVPIFQDGIPRNASATQLVGLFDSSALTVLKGPQGSGLFRNASAGAIVVKTNAPQPEYSGSARMSLSRIASVDARDANRYSFESAMNAPVFEDIISVRLSARYTHENPFWENRCANRVPLAGRPVQVQGQPSVAFCGEQVGVGSASPIKPNLHRFLGEVDDYGFRGQIRIDPPDFPMEWTLRVELSNLNRDSTTGQHIGTGAGFLGQGDVLNYRDRDLVNRNATLLARVRAENPTMPLAVARQVARQKLEKEVYKDPLDRRPYAGDVNTPGRTILETHSVSTTGVYEGDVAETTVNFGFVDYRKSEGRDTDLSPNQRFGSIADDQAWELYGDLAVKGDSIGSVPLSWDTGVYSIYEKVEALNRQDLTSLELGGVQNFTQFTQQIFGWGAYAETSYEFLEAFTFSAGLRYNWERKDFEVDNNAVRLLFGNLVKVLTDQSDNQRTWDALTGFVNLEYAFTEDISSYVKYTRGFKAGHFNPSDAGAAKVPGEGFADPENIDSFEWGLKSSFWANRITAGGAFFFYNYTDYQVFRLTTNFQGVSRVVQNAKEARNFGAEFDLTIRPIEGFVPEEIEGLNVTFHGGWLEAQFVEFAVTEQRIFDSGSLGVPIDYSGNSLLNSPNLEASLLVNWPLVTPEYGTFTPQYDFTWIDDIPFDPNNGRGEPTTDGRNRFQPYHLGNRAYMLHNVRLTWTPPNEPGFEVSGWCRNVTDERYKTFAIDLSTFSTQQLVYVADPRLCGADFRFTW